MGHGFSATQDRLFSSAELFASEGLAVLTIDYRKFGESGGKPRQVIDIKGQRADFTAAVAFVRSLPEIDPERVALWGSSLGGTHTLFVAAEDSRVAAVVAQIPYSGRPKKSVGRNKAQIKRIMNLALKDTIRGWFGMKPLYVPAVGSADDNAILVDPHAKEVTKSLSANNSLWRNEIAPRVIFDILRLNPLKIAKNIKAPLLVTIAEKDTEAPIYLTKRLADLAPRGEVQTYPISHYEMYQPDIRQKVLLDQLKFLKKHLLKS
jgi:hypothetical protein